MARRPVLRFNVTINMRPLTDVTRYAEKNRPALVEVAAKRYLRYLQDRYLRLSAGGGEWPELTEKTVASKRSRGVADDPEAIMRESDVTLEQLAIHFYKNGAFVGYGAAPIGVSRPSSFITTTNELVRLHNHGNPAGNLPERAIIKKPTPAVKKKMVDDIRKEYNKVIRRYRRKK